MPVNIFKRGSKTPKSPLSPAPTVQFISTPHTFTDEPMELDEDENEDADSLVSRALARSSMGLASPYQNSNHHQMVPYRSNGGSVGYNVLDDDEPTFSMYHRASEPSSQSRAQTPMDRRTGRSATQMQSPTEQSYERGPKIRPPKRSDTIKNTILFASRFAATVLPNSWGSGAFSIATTIMDAIDRARLNEDLTNDLMAKFRAFLYLLGKMKDKTVPPPVLEAFEESLDELKTFSEGAIATISRAVNVDDIRKQIDRIERKLNSAIQQLQTALQLSVIERLDQISSNVVDQWIERSMKDPRMQASPGERSMNGTEFISKKNFHAKLVTDGHAKNSMINVRVNSKGDFKSYTRGNTLQESWHGGLYESDGDLVIDSIATSGLSNWQQSIPRWQ